MCCNQSIYFIHDIPFFATTNFELNIFITINMQIISIIVVLLVVLKCLVKNLVIGKTKVNYITKYENEHQFNNFQMKKKNLFNISN
jgi:hypothetical protein